MAAKPPTRQEMLDFCEQTSKYLFEMRFNSGRRDPTEPLPLPPTLPDSTVLHTDVRHYSGCRCPICMDALYKAAGL